MEPMNNDKTLRFVVKGNHEGHQVDMYLYDEDFAAVTNGEELIEDIEVGALQYAIARLHEHGVTPYQRSSGASAPASGGGGAAAPAGFSCPEHGGKFIKDNPFEPGLRQCGIFEPAENLNDKPDWARDKPTQSKKDNKWYWNCKYREWKDK